MKKITSLATACLILIMGAFLITNENLFQADDSKEMVIQDGIYIGGIDVSGMTADEATTAVDSYVAGLKEQWVVLEGPKNTLRYQLGDLGLSANTSVAVQEAIAVGNAGSLIKRFQTLQDLENDNLVVDMRLGIDKQLTANKIYSKRSKIDVKAIDNSVKRENGNFVYVPGQDGDEVDIVTAVNELNAYIGAEWEIAPVQEAKFKLTSVVSHPRGTQEQLSVIKDLLGSFSTNYSSSGWGRAKNVENGASKINGTIMYPGDELSVYELVNPFTKENGYELAGSYLNGETVESFGGGICQVSTTLYNAALLAELEITQRYNHSMIVNYVDPSADAAIAGTYKDLRFKNNYDFPILIEGVCSNRNITFNVYGVETRDASRKVSYVSEVVTENDPPTEFTLSEGHPVGSFVQTRSKHIGYVAKLWKVVTVGGVEQEKTQVNKSTYKASCRKVTIGTAGATPEQLAAINEALATQDDNIIKAVVEGLGTPADAQPTPAPTPTPTPEPTPTPAPTPTPEPTPTPDPTPTPNPGNGTGENGNTGTGESEVPGTGGSETPETSESEMPETGTGDNTGNGNNTGSNNSSNE